MDLNAIFDRIEKDINAAFAQFESRQAERHKKVLSHIQRLSDLLDKRRHSKTSENKSIDIGSTGELELTDDLGSSDDEQPFFFLETERLAQAKHEGRHGWGEAALGHGDDRKVGENGEEAEGIRFPSLPRTEMAPRWRAGDCENGTGSMGARGVGRKLGGGVESGAEGFL